MSPYRLAHCEARTEAAEVRATLPQVARRAEAAGDAQCNVLDELRKRWGLYVKGAARHSGADRPREAAK